MWYLVLLQDWIFLTDWLRCMWRSGSECRIWASIHFTCYNTWCTWFVSQGWGPSCWSFLFVIIYLCLILWFLTVMYFWVFDCNIYIFLQHYYNILMTVFVIIYLCLILWFLTNIYIFLQHYCNILMTVFVIIFLCLILWFLTVYVFLGFEL
jgi:hypothetical protein